MPGHRRPAVAGSFYPEDPNELRRLIRGFLCETAPAGAPPKAVVAPHAGYLYSGPTAAHAYARLALGRDRIRRVVLLGPSHRVAFRGLALSGAEAWDTPFGAVRIDPTAADALRPLPWVRVFESAHAQEHSLEVQLPFLQEVLDDFALVPLVAGEATPSEVAEVLERLWGGPETAVVISSDLSHYLDHATAQRRDRATSESILALDGARLDEDSACGRLPLRGLLVVAKARGLQSELLDLRTSGDTAGDGTRVVGYGAYAFA